MVKAEWSSSQILQVLFKISPIWFCSSICRITHMISLDLGEKNWEIFQMLPPKCSFLSSYFLEMWLVLNPFILYNFWKVLSVLDWPHLPVLLHLLPNCEFHVTLFWKVISCSLPFTPASSTLCGYSLSHMQTLQEKLSILSYFVHKVLIPMGP